MKKITLLFTILISSLAFSQEQAVTFSISPSNFTVNDEITITASNVDPTIWNAGEPNNIYLWAWYFNSCGEFVSGPINGNGDWGNSEDYLQLTNNGDSTYSYVLTPSAFFADTDISEIGVLVKAEDGSGDKKSQDHLFYVGDGIVISISDPTVNPVILNSGDDVDIDATISTQGSTDIGSFIVFLNEVQVASGSGFPLYSTTLTNITTSGTVRVQGTPNGSSENSSCSFEIIIAPTVVEEAIPAGMVEGINYDGVDATIATLVLDAPLKDFVYIAGSFNNYNPDNSYLMKKDPGTGKFWLELTGLTSLQIETYQYWVYAISPVTDSPQIVKTADPYSTLVLSPFDDPWTPASSYPNIPTYPAGQEREVTVLQTGKTPYSWVVNNFTKPKKEDLIVYEVLIRDFDKEVDGGRSYQHLIDRIDYFKNLNVNAIELMPVMEYEGAEGWGYNTAFHMALDKFYGTEDKLREFIDVCHQNGIAVILDVALNHAYGRSPMVRMWMDDPDNDGWGGPSSENPYMNQVATHSYSVGSDFNHQQSRTQNYVERVVKHWIEEFKIDGFRWDLTKGFTQNCTSGDENCTNTYQQDRVDVLQSYADYSWSLDETHYVIFEHLGADNEEQQWANYRLGDAIPKGIMMWSEMFDAYKNLAQGNSSDISRIGHTAHGFTAKRTLGYPESHDKDRIMYEMTEFGNNNGGGYDVKNLNTALSRMSAIGAITIPIPGPKMIWHFADLGMDNSIWTCSDGSVNSDYDGNGDGDCKLDTKPQPQWESAENWPADPNRSQIYNDWARLNELKINEDVFEGNYTINSGNLTPRIYIWDDALPNLKNVVILANFDVTTQNVTPDFPYIGDWYDLMDETGSTSINVTNTTTPISIPAGEFRIYGNQGVTLSTDDFDSTLDLIVFPNPVKNTFSINKNITFLQVFDLTGKIVKEFKGNFSKGETFDISNLSRSLYILKITNNSGQQQATKLVKL